MEILHPVTSKLHDGSEGVGNGKVLDLHAQYANVVLQVTGITTATVTFKGSLNGEDWVNLAGYHLTTGAGAVSTVANGIFSIPVIGISYFKAEITAHTDGTIDVLAQIMPVSGERVIV